MQGLIDDGIQYCEPCDSFGRQRFCGHCGQRFVGRELEWRECPGENCRALVSTDYCPLCGEQVALPDVDWEAMSAHATSIMTRLVQARPDVAQLIAGSETPQNQDLVSALNSVFGG